MSEVRFSLDTLAASDAEMYQADIFTGPDFGCIHHQESPNGSADQPVSD